MQRWAAAERIPAGLLEALCWMESGWQNGARSATGAIGLGQIEPSTARFISHDLLHLRRTLDPSRPNDNLELAATYLAWLLQGTHGNVADALGGYYQGSGSLQRRGPLPSTRHYVMVVGQLWAMFRSG